MARTISWSGLKTGKHREKIELNKNFDIEDDEFYNLFTEGDVPSKLVKKLHKLAHSVEIEDVEVDGQPAGKLNKVEFFTLLTSELPELTVTEAFFWGGVCNELMEHVTNIHQMEKIKAALEDLKSNPGLIRKIQKGEISIEDALKGIVSGDVLSGRSSEELPVEEVLSMMRKATKTKKSEDDSSLKKKSAKDIKVKHYEPTTIEDPRTLNEIEDMIAKKLAESEV